MVFKKYWQAVLHWSGWKIFANSCVTVWKRVVRWSGWKTIFALPLSAVTVLSMLCTAGLIWVFVRNRE